MSNIKIFCFLAVMAVLAGFAGANDKNELIIYSSTLVLSLGIVSIIYLIVRWCGVVPDDNLKKKISETNHIGGVE